MPLTKLYIPAVLLLLALSCPLWHVGQSLPITGEGPMTDSCVLHARALLRNVTDVLAQNNLFKGFDCSRQKVELNMETDTPSVCAPKGSTCTGITKIEFDQTSCMEKIERDLEQYYIFLAAQPKDLLGPTFQLLKTLMESCFPRSLSKASEPASANHQRTFDDRLSLCKVLKGFQVRTITINRVIAYMNSGEHSK